MTDKDIICMAREAGIGPVYGNDSIERFAALVAAAEREACAKVCDEVVRDLYTDSDAFEEVLRCTSAIRARGQNEPR